MTRAGRIRSIDLCWIVLAATINCCSAASAQAQTATQPTHNEVAGNTIHQVGLTNNFGWATTVEYDVQANGKSYSSTTYGDSANLLTPGIADANTMIPETKAFMVNVEKKQGRG